MGWLKKLFLPEPRKGHYSRVRDAKDNYKVSSEIVDYDYLENIEFNKKNQHLSFDIIHYHKQPKVTRYVTIDYVRTPIYGDYSERTKIIKKFNRTIDPLKFVNQELLTIIDKFPDIDSQYFLKIISAIGTKPKWMIKQENIEKIKRKISNWENRFRYFEHEKSSYPQEPFYDAEKPSNFWIRFIFSFITLGLSFIGFVSKARAQINIGINAEKRNKYNKEKRQIDKANQKLAIVIKKHNNKIKTAVLRLNKELIRVQESKIQLVETDSDGWLNLRQAISFPDPKLKNAKGVYVIWNKTKNKHYVGQTKNLERRIFRQHFNKGEIQNIKFAKDWFGGDNFFLKYVILQTRDELDRVEKDYIGKYNSFENGYNGTHGNI